MITKLGQVDGKFGLEISPIGPKMSDYFGHLGKIADLLTEIDRFLLSYLMPLKFRLKHYLFDGRNANQFFIQEEVGLGGDAEDLATNYLRRGKELILSKLDGVSQRDGFDVLLHELTPLINMTKQKIEDSLTFEGFSCITIDELELIRLLNKLWDFFNGPGGSLEVKVLNEPCQRVFFSSEPQFNNWIDDEKRGEGTAWFRIVVANFEKRDWKARLLPVKDKRQVCLRIDSPSFLEKLQSSTVNKENGRLIGDVLLVRYEIEEKVLEKKITYAVKEVLDHFRADEITHQMDLDL